MYCPRPAALYCRPGGEFACVVVVQGVVIVQASRNPLVGNEDVIAAVLSLFQHGQ